MFPFDARKIATHRLTCAVRLRRSDIAYSAGADLPASMLHDFDADGADQLFARVVLDQGGHLEVIVPAARYRDDLPRESHLAASELMISMVSELLAVWDGKPARD